MHRTLVLFASLLWGCGATPNGSTRSPADGDKASATASTVAPPVARTAERKSFRVTIEGAGPSVVLIPGLTCGGHVWDPTVAHLKATHTLHVLTLSGFAGRPRIDGPFLPVVRDELAAYVGELERPVLVGHSLGGFMAFWLAATEPDAVAGAVAVDGLPALGALSGQDAEAVATFASQMRTQMEGLSQQAFAEQTQQTLMAQISNPEQAAAVAEVSALSDPAAVGQAMEELLTTDLRPQLSQVTAPVLLLGAGAGTASQVSARGEQYRAQVAAVPHHEVVMVPATRHFVMLDAPEAFRTHLDHFLEAAG